MKHRQNKGEGGLAVVLVLVVIIAVAYFAVPAFQTWITNAWTNFKGWWNSNYGSYFTLEITYSDGSTREFSSTPLTIVDPGTGLSVTKITVIMKISIDYTGEIQTFNGNTGVALILKHGTTGNVLRTLLTKSGSFSGGTMTPIPVNTPTEVWRTDITMAEVQSNQPTWMDNTEYILRIEPSTVTFNITFKDGKTDSKPIAIPAAIEWRFKYLSSSGITSISVMFISNPS